VLQRALLGEVAWESLVPLLECVVRHQAELLADRTFNANTNHGFYVAAGQLAFARRLSAFPGMAEVTAQGTARMRVMARGQFAADGGHREHSPGYHRMVLASFLGVRDAGLLTDPDVLTRLRRAEDALGWFVLPNGEIAQVGDTGADRLRFPEATSASPTTAFQLSGGHAGTPDTRRLKVLPEAGYAIVRSPQPTGTEDHEDAGYLLLAGGFHSRAHKHADDLSIIWFDRRREILVDAGRYGYVHELLPPDHPLRRRGFYYSAPERQYVESTRAHNTAEADGLDHRRLGRRPYGSAISGARERDGHFQIRAVVNHGTWRHRREVVFRPGRWMLVTDVVTGLDRRRHDFRVWWNFPYELRPRPIEVGRLAIDVPDSDDTLWVTELGGNRTIPVVAGRRDPMRGWRSKVDLEATPAWSTGFHTSRVRRHTFRTLFHFGPEPRRAPFRHPFA
jgi:hypothetical protein